MDKQCPSCGGFCKKSGCERENTLMPGSIIYDVNPPVKIVGEMSLRDYFAAKAMQSLLMAPTDSWPNGVDISVSVAAYQLADSMLEARSGE